MASTATGRGSDRKLTALITLRLEPLTVELLDQKVRVLREQAGELLGIPLPVARAMIARHALKLYLSGRFEAR